MSDKIWDDAVAEGKAKMIESMERAIRRRIEIESSGAKSECHCGKDGHALNSVNCPVHGLWRPIETAPSDVDLLVWDRWGSICIARRKAKKGDWIAIGSDGPAIRCQDDFGTEYQEPCPSYWMSLPAPPETGE